MTGHRRLALAVLATVLAVAACGDDPAPGGDADPVAAAGDGTTAAPAAAAPPPVVIAAGDSILYDVSPALVDAFEPDRARVIPLVTPSLAEASSATLHQRIVEDGADLAVVMVGVWERDHVTASGLDVGDPGFAEEYRREALDPLREAVTSVGGQALLLGPPPLRDPAAEAELEELEAVWQRYADAEPAVDFVDTDAWLGDFAAFVEVATATDGSSVRLRRVDGTHLCEEGARRIATGVVDTIDARLGVGPNPGWQRAGWTSRFPADECPPVP